jgi:hypothetical protein
MLLVQSFLGAITFANCEAILARGIQDLPTPTHTRGPGHDRNSDSNSCPALDAAIMDVSRVTDVDTDGAEALGRIAKHLQSLLRCAKGTESSGESVLVVGRYNPLSTVGAELPPGMLSDLWFIKALEAGRVFASLDDALAAAPGRQQQEAIVKL